MLLPVLLPGKRHWWYGRASVRLDPTTSHICSWPRVHCSLTRHITSSWPPLLAAVWYCLTDGPRVMNYEGSNELLRNSALSLGQQRFMFAARVLTDSLYRSVALQFSATQGLLLFLHMHILNSVRFINLLAPELFSYILAHPVYKMWIKHGPNTLELWNKLYFEEKKTESIHHV